MAERTTRSRQAAPSRRPRRSFLWRVRRGLFLVALLMVAGVAGAGFVLAQVGLPEEDPLLQSTFVCASDVTEGCGPSNSIAKLAGEVDRVSVPIEEIPQTFIDAVLAAEDRNFYSHSGIDPVGIARALYQGLRDQGVQQGGSTITQQYAKNAFLTSDRTITRKVKEAVLAIKLERELPKDEILERYINTVYFGRGAYGADAAARAYFGVSIREVDLSQAAYLAGLVRAPESADVSSDPEVATFRRNSVLRGMLEVGTITEAEFESARAIDLRSQVRERTVRDGLGVVEEAPSGTEHYVEYVRRLLYRRYGADVVNGGGLRVYTSLDKQKQQQAYDSVYGFLDREDDPAGALVSIDHVGRVVAMVGGRNFDDSEVNLALGGKAGGSGRPAGSAFKPLVLATALSQDISARSKFIDEDEVVLPDANAGEDWEVSNYSPGAERLMDLVDATRVSSNTIYAQLMLEVGPRNVVAMADELGIDTELPAVNSLVLGSGDVSVLDMASAYSTFSRRGQQVDPIFITKVEQVVDGEVKVLDTADAPAEQVIRQADADQVNWILRRVIEGGTGTAADIGIPAAGKTGTSQDHRDAWFVGYTPKLTTAVWMGYPNVSENGEPRLMNDVRGRRVTGGSFPAEIWRTYMAQATAGTDQGSFAEPPPFGGRILNPDLSTTTTTTAPRTTTTLPICEADSGDSGEGDGSEGPCRTTTTTEPDDDGGGTTTTSTQPPGTTTTTSTPPSPTSSSTTVAPTTTEFLEP